MTRIPTPQQRTNFGFNQGGKAKEEIVDTILIRKPCRIGGGCYPG